MIPYLLILASSFLLVLVQGCFLDRLLFYKTPVEITLLVVLYAAWNWENEWGIFATLSLGVLMDWFFAPFYGLYCLSYFLVFFTARFLKAFLGQRTHSDILLVALAVFIEFLVFVTFYEGARASGVFGLLWRVYLPQSVLLCLLASPLFNLMAKIDKRFSDEQG